MEELKQEFVGSVFDINGDLNPGTAFDMPGGGVIYLRVCAGDDLKAIRKQTVEKKKEYKEIKGTMHRLVYEETKEDLQSELIWDFSIINWERLFDAAKNPIPCTKENKIKLMGKSVIFSKFVSDCLEKMRKDLGIVEEEETKN